MFPNLFIDYLSDRYKMLLINCKKLFSCWNFSCLQDALKKGAYKWANKTCYIRIRLKLSPIVNYKISVFIWELCKYILRINFAMTINYDVITECTIVYCIYVRNKFLTMHIYCNRRNKLCSCFFAFWSESLIQNCTENFSSLYNFAITGAWS